MVLGACVDLSANLSNVANAEINCYELNACDHLRVRTDNDKIYWNKKQDCDVYKLL